jgi:hypothetical protein
MGQAEPTQRIPRWARLASVTAVGGALLLAACGNTSSSASSQQTPTDAVSNLTSRSSLEMSVSLGLTQSQIQSLSSANGDTPVSASAAKSLSDGTVFFGIQSGHGESLDSSSFSSDTDNRSGLGATVGDATPVEIRAIDQTVYARIDPASVSSLSSESGKSSDITSQLQQLSTVVPGLSALAKGDWVSVSQSQLKTLEQLGGAGASTGSSSSLPEDQASQLWASLVSALKEHSTFTSQGTKDGQSVYDVTLDAKAFADQVGPEIQKSIASLPSSVTGKLPNVGSSTSSIPAGKTLTFTVFAKDGFATELNFDARQLGVKADFPVTVQIKFSETNISQPQGATSIDLSKLGQILGGLGHSSSSSSSATAA